ncbi:MAG TPA: 2-dehydro-3-deoxygalactonokinase [Stellaceae bacterium]|nr:2-dehydro-3-deoxygalactonokinase [Stellaceae bacterium]
MIAIDWGTSSFRAYRVDAGGRIIDQRSAPRGILKVEAGGFAGVLGDEIGAWLDQETGAIFMSGMIGSRQGWKEVPYLPCPADLEAVARASVEVDWDRGRRVFIVPGISCRDAQGVPDVMRGEETQIIGALDELGKDAMVCLPGTHSKYVRVADRRIVNFTTHMTGEVFGVLWRHSILGRLGGSETIDDDRAFDAGVDRSLDGQGLLHHLFGVRSRGLFGEVPASGLASYLSGLLIGHEIRATEPAVPVAVIGSADLSRLYCRAFARCGLSARPIGGEPAVRGLWTIARSLAAAP